MVRTVSGDRKKTLGLIIDDEPTFLRIAQQFLETRYGQEIEIIGTARSGEEGLAKAQLYSPQLILIDINMSGLSDYKRFRCSVSCTLS